MSLDDETRKESQKMLVSILTSVHQTLRQAKRDGDEEEWQRAWEEHTSDFKTLQAYSKAMHALATTVWEPRHHVSTEGSELPEGFCRNAEDKKSEKLKCRLEWVVRRSMEYFQVSEGSAGEFSSGVRNVKLKLLDVGSCYNPFSKFSEIFDIVAVDLCPAPGLESQVFQCDFLALNVEDRSNDDILELSSFLPPTTSISVGAEEGCAYRKLESLPSDYFDVIVFSYFLEYLADTKQRLACCRKALRLLRTNGLLFILRPDSSRVTPGGNNRLVKKLKVGMAMIGLKRVYFEKLEHLWCMGFRKLGQDDCNAYVESPNFKKDVEKVDAVFALEDTSRLHELFSIAQDSQVVIQNTSTSYTVEAEGTTRMSDCFLMEELPGYNTSSEEEN